MDIQSAAVYMNAGYRIRRTSWGPHVYLFGPFVWKQQIHTSYRYDLEKRKRFITRFAEVNHSEPLEIEDLLANDWVVITTGIKKYFDEFGKVTYKKQKVR